MLDSDLYEFAQVLKATLSYYGRDADKMTMDIYWNGLKRFGLGDVKRGLNLHMQNPDSGQFMPKIADVVKMLEGGTGTVALRAWSAVDAAVRRIGTWQSGVFDDPIIHRVLQDMGGWIYLGEKTDDEWPFVSNEFVKRYQTYKLQGGVEKYPRLLCGMAMVENDSKDVRSDPPIMIGNQAKAKLVFDGGGDVAAIEFKPMAALLENLMDCDR